MVEWLHSHNVTFALPKSPAWIWAEPLGTGTSSLCIFFSWTSACCHFLFTAEGACLAWFILSLSPEWEALVWRCAWAPGHWGEVVNMTGVLRTGLPHLWISHGFCAVTADQWTEPETAAQIGWCRALCIPVADLPVPMSTTVHTSFCNSLKYWWQRFLRDVEEVLQGLVEWHLSKSTFLEKSVAVTSLKKLSNIIRKLDSCYRNPVPTAIIFQKYRPPVAHQRCCWLYSHGRNCQVSVEFFSIHNSTIATKWFSAPLLFPQCLLDTALSSQQLLAQMFTISLETLSLLLSPCPPWGPYKPTPKSLGAPHSFSQSPTAA